MEVVKKSPVDQPYTILNLAKNTPVIIKGGRKVNKDVEPMYDYTSLEAVVEQRESIDKTESMAAVEQTPQDTPQDSPRYSQDDEYTQS